MIHRYSCSEHLVVDRRELTVLALVAAAFLGPRREQPTPVDVDVVALVALNVAMQQILDVVVMLPRPPARACQQKKRPSEIIPQ